MKFLFFPFLIILYSCGNSNKQPLTGLKVNELRTFIETNLKTSDSTVKLDSFRFLRIDTVTQQQLYYTIIMNIYDDMDKNSKLSDQTLQLLKSNAQLATLWRGLDNTLYNTYKKDYEDEKEKFDDLQIKSTLLLNKAHSFNVLREKADTIHPVAFQTVNLIQIRFTDQSVRKDTGYVFLNLDKNIIKREDLFKYE